MTIAGFSIQDGLGKIWFFEETFLLADTSMDVVLRMPFLSLSNADVQFDKGNLTWRIYSTSEALPKTRQVQLIDKHKLAREALNKNSVIFVVYVAALEALKLAIHLSQAPLLAALQQDKAPIKIPSEYIDYTNVFSLDLAMQLPENTSINKHAIELIEGKEPLYKPIYSLGPVELETLKAYIEIYFKTGFIWPSKSLIDAPIFFDKKPDRSLRLCIDYQELNNLTIKNRYPLPLIGDSLDWLVGAKRFTQLDLTSAYQQMRIREGDE